jgi:hypothetical protein
MRCRFRGHQNYRVHRRSGNPAGGTIDPQIPSRQQWYYFGIMNFKKNSGAG